MTTTTRIHLATLLAMPRRDRRLKPFVSFRYAPFQQSTKAWDHQTETQDQSGSQSRGDLCELFAQKAPGEVRYKTAQRQA